MPAHRFLVELREFLRFLTSLWGLLAGISLLFPLSNLLVDVIPVADGGRPFQNLAPQIVTALSTVTCVFVTFATFARRDEFAVPHHRSRLVRSSKLSFTLGAAALAVYVLTTNGMYRLLVTQASENEFGVAIYDGMFAAMYIAFFALLTRAFLILAVLEYAARSPDNNPDGNS
jgi:hypothetical protein